MTRDYLYRHIQNIETLRRLTLALEVLTDECARADVSARVGALEAEVNAERRAVVDFAERITDIYVRAIFIARYADGTTWGAIADKLGGGNTADGVRKTCERGIDGLIDA